MNNPELQDYLDIIKEIIKIEDNLLTEEDNKDMDIALQQIAILTENTPVETMKKYINYMLDFNNPQQVSRFRKRLNNNTIDTPLKYTFWLMWNDIIIDIVVSFDEDLLIKWSPFFNKQDHERMIKEFIIIANQYYIDAIIHILDILGLRGKLPNISLYGIKIVRSEQRKVMNYVGYRIFDAW